jgi:hypothetical protein
MVVRDQVRELVLSVWPGPGGIGDHTPLLEGSGLDGASLRTLAGLVEQRFVVDVHDDEVGLESFGSVARLAAFVERKLAVLQTCRFEPVAVRVRGEDAQSGDGARCDEAPSGGGTLGELAPVSGEVGEGKREGIESAA